MHSGWLEHIDTYLKSCRIGDKPLAGVKIRVRRSKRGEFSRVGAALEAILEKHGASILNVEDLSQDLECRHGFDRLSDIDAFIMLSATTGVSAEALELAHIRDEGEPPIKDRLYVAMPKEYDSGFIYKRLKFHKVLVYTYQEADIKAGYLCRNIIGKLIENKRERDEIMKARAAEFKPTIGIVTALPIEYEAAISLLQNPRDDRRMPTPGSLHEYVHGTVSGFGGGNHEVVVTRAGVGNNLSSIKSEQLIRDFPDLAIILMVGIAGGIPKIKDTDSDVRLGDVVVSGKMGVIQYDMVKDTRDGENANHAPRPPSHAWLSRATNLINDTREKNLFEQNLIEHLAVHSKFARPSNETDQLFDDSNPSSPIEIKRTAREHSNPLVFEGAVGSANRVVKNHSVREDLRNRYQLLAVEMEGSGVADAAMANGTSFFVIRGICDYANDGKNKIWQPYAAMSAAAFAAELIKSMPKSQ